MPSLTAPRDTIALDIGSSSIAAARVTHGRNGPAVARTAVHPLPDGLVSDGTILDAAGLAGHIKRMWKEERLSGRRVRLGLANPQVSVRTLELPMIEDADEMRAAVEFEAGEHMPIPLHEAVLDFQPLIRAEGEPEDRRRVIAVAAPREIVDGLVAAVTDAGLRPVGVDLEAFALLRALLPPADPEPERRSRAAVVVCHVGHRNTNVVVSVDRQCHFVRLVPFAGSQLTAAVAEGVHQEPADAELLKIACGLLGPIPDGWDADKVRDVRRALAFGARPLVDELRRSLDFYRSQPTARPIARIVLAGGTALCAGLDRYVQQALGIRTVVGDPLQNLTDDGRVPPEVAARAAVALGLAMPERDAR